MSDKPKRTIHEGTLELEIMAWDPGEAAAILDRIATDLMRSYDAVLDAYALPPVDTKVTIDAQKGCLVCGQYVESGVAEEIHRKAHLDREAGHGAPGKPVEINCGSYEDSDLDEAIEPKSLLDDDTCLLCFHGPHIGYYCEEWITDPPIVSLDLPPFGYPCSCDNYVTQEDDFLIPDPYDPDDQYEDDDEEETIDQEARRLVFGPRQATYGHPAADFEAMGRISGAILGRWFQSQGIVLYQRGPNGPFDLGPPIPFPDIEPRIVALLMTAVKLSRESAQHKRDNLVDLIGYTLCAQRIVDADED